MAACVPDSLPFIDGGRNRLPSHICSDIVSQLSATERRHFAFLLYGVCPRPVQTRIVVALSNETTVSAELLKSVLEAAPADNATLVREALYIMKKFALLRKSMNVCQHLADREFRLPKMISEYWKMLAEFCNNCLDEEAKRICEFLMPDEQVLSLSSEAVVLQLHRSGIIKDGDLSKLHNCLKKNFQIDELLRPLSMEIGYYPMTHSPHGEVIILNHNTFRIDPEHPDIILTERQGSAKDVADLVQLWTDFNFRVSVHNDKTASKVQELLTRIVCDVDPDSADAFVLIILSHGYKGGFYAHDTKRISLDKVEQILCDHSESLQSKPKIMCVQACQRADSKPGQLQPTDSSNAVSSPAIRRADVLKLMSTVPDHVSFRDPDSGSLFIQTLIRVMRTYWSTCSLRDITTKLIGMVSSMGILECVRSTETEYRYQVPEVTDSMGKSLYLRMQ